jgi:protein-S-isoprenylcysteine O-methyltransferase Ste14
LADLVVTSSRIRDKSLFLETKAASQNMNKTGKSHHLSDVLTDLFFLALAMAGYVHQKASVTRKVIMVVSALFAAALYLFYPHNATLSLVYFAVAEVFYFGFIFTVLPHQGLRLLFIKKQGEEKGYLGYETILGFLFFHNWVSMGYVTTTHAGTLTIPVNTVFLFIVTYGFFIGGFAIKLWAAYVVSKDIYYWKDMFLGRKISSFVSAGPYRFFSNPMYGIGQVPAYASALWYGSKWGLWVAFINQLLIFTFYFLEEKKFIRRVYRANV